MSEQKPPAPKSSSSAVSSGPRSSAQDIAAFVNKARELAATGTGSGRLILALDATMSRQPTWDLACALQGEMFDAVGKAGALNVQLVYFRGLGECRASKFVADTASLKRLMSGLDCRGGHTQIGKVLAHALKETSRGKVEALVYIGDAMEEDVDALADKAGQLGLHGVPVFLFQEGQDHRRRGRFQGDRPAVEGRMVPLRPNVGRQRWQSSCRRLRSSPRAGSRRLRRAAAARIG